MGKKVDDLTELTQTPDANDEFYILDNSEPSGSRGKRIKFDKLIAGALSEHVDGGPNKHDATEIDYERADENRTDIQNSSDSTEEALSDLDDNKLSRTGSQVMTGSLDLGGNNILNVNLVDGRDVSADGAKLDTIEPNATADQNALEVPFDNSNTLYASNQVQGVLEEIDSVFEEPTELIVSKTPGPGQFSTITAALASITDSSALKPYKINVKSGTYIEPTIQMKSYVALEGSSGLSTVIQTNAPTNNIIELAPFSLVSNFVLTGSTAAGAAAICLESTSAGESTGIVRDLAVSQANILFRINATAGRAALTVDSINIDDNTTFDKMVVATSVSGAEAVIRLGNALITQFNNPFPTSLFDISGPGAEVVAGNIASQVTGGSVTAVQVSNGASIKTLSGSFRGFDRGLLVPNVGIAPIIRCSGLTIEDSFTNDIEVNHPDTEGFILGNMDSTKVVIDSSASLKLVLSDTGSDSTGLTVLGDIKQGPIVGEFLNLSELVREDATMGLITGGVLSDNGGLSIAVTSGRGFLLDSAEDFIKEVSWQAGSINLTADSTNYVYINSNGIISSSANRPNLLNNIILGRVITLGASIHYIDRIPVSMKHGANSIFDFLLSALGPVVASGIIVSENAINPLQLDVTSGEYWLSSNKFTPTGGSDVEFEIHYRDGTGGYTHNILTQTIDNANYDDGSGTLSSLTAGYYAKHAFYLVGDGADELYLQVYAQAEYANLAQAESAPLPIPPSSFTDGGIVRVASIIVQQGNPNIVKILDERPIVGTNISAVSSSSDHGSLAGLNDDDHPQYLLADGSRSLSGNLDMGGNNVTNVNLVDGIDVTTHALRHLPNGSDPLTTAAPTTNLNGNTNNTVGSANSFSRSDHTHSIDDATTSIAGLMSSSDKTKLDGIEANAKDDQSALEVPYDNTSSGLSSTNVKSAIDEVEARVENNETDISNLQSNKQNISEKGQANGYASLDSGGKVPTSQLPTKIMEFEGNWNASTNTPTLSNTDTDKQGTVYRVSVAGSVDFGAGSISFQVGDWVFNNGSVWDKGDNTDQVSSVFGRQGTVIAQAGDYDDIQVDYTRADGNKKSISASSDDVGSAINDLDDNKLARNGSQVMTGSLDMGGNNVTNVNLVDGIDVSAHAARHLPGGADPLTTAAAVNISSNTNALGSNNSFSRSDHTHQVTQNSPTAGQLIRWDGSDWQAYSPIVGYAEADAQQTNATTTYAQALRLTVNIPETGNYYIEWSWEASNNTKDRDVYMRVQIDDTTTIMEHSHGRQNDQVTPTFYGGAGFKRANLTAGSHNIDFDFRAPAGTATMKNLRMVVKRL